MKKSRVYLLMVFTYIAIFMLPLIAGNIGFATVHSRLIDEVARTNLLTLSQSSVSIEAELNRIQEMGLFLSQNSTIRKYLASDLTRAEDRYLAREAIDIFNARLNEMNYADDAVIYCTGHRSIITTTSLAPAKLYLDYLVFPLEIPREQVIDWMDQFHSYYDLYAVNIEKNGIRLPSVVVAQILPKDSISNKLGVLLVSIPQHSLLSTLEEINPDGSYAIVTNDGKVLAANDSRIANMDLSAIRDEKGFVKVTGEHGIVWLSYVQFQRYGLSVISVVSEDIWMEPVRSSQRVFLIAYGICIVIGSLLVLYFSRRQYLPIGNLVTNLRQMGIEQPDRDEYRYIHNAINSILQENGVLTKRVQELGTEQEHFLSLIERSREQIQSSIVLGLTHGAVENREESLALMRTYGVNFSKKWFLTAILDVSRAADSDGLIFNVIRQQIESAFSDRIELCTSLYRNMPLLVVNADSKEELHAAAAKMEEMTAQFARQMRMTVRIFTGRPHAELNGVSLSFGEAEKLFLASEKKETAVSSKTNPLSVMIREMEDLITQQRDAQILLTFRRFLNQNDSEPIAQSYFLTSVARIMMHQLEDQDNHEASDLIEAWKHLIVFGSDSREKTVKEALSLMQQSMDMLSADRENARNGSV
ncbi:MAG: hypothetical protein IJI38_00245, partial [Clostridia bacterium]|nr:hypothetical protein [Clostridia bacterium]